MPIDIASDGPETLIATIRNDVSELGPLAKALADFGARNKIPANAIYRVDLALELLLINVIRYGYGENSGEREIRISIALAEGGIVVQMEDDAMAFDPLAVPPPDIGAAIERHPRQGLGLHLVRAVVDSIAYERRGERNCLTLSLTF